MPREERDIPFCGKGGDGSPTVLLRFESANSVLAAKLRPKVYEYGFLK